MIQELKVSSVQVLARQVAFEGGNARWCGHSYKHRTDLLRLVKEKLMANLDANRLRNMNRYWQAANYLTIGQIYLQ